MGDDHERFMRMALEEARKAVHEGNGPVGSVVVRDGEVVALGRNLVVTTHDATAHAETDAIRNAGAAQGDYDLSGCTIYTTYEPCPMCCGAILNAGISTVVLGGRPAPGESRYGPYTIETLIDHVGWSDRVQVITGVLTRECVDVMNSARDEDE